MAFAVEVEVEVEVEAFGERAKTGIGVADVLGRHAKARPVLVRGGQQAKQAAAVQTPESITDLLHLEIGFNGTPC